MDQHHSIFFARRHDFRRIATRHAPDAVFEQLWAEIEEPDFLRSAVITLHLYVEYWLDKLLKQLWTEKRPKKSQLTFNRKALRLRKLGSLSSNTFGNIDRINKIRNIYAHELDLAHAEVRVHRLMAEMWLDPYFMTNDPDRLRAVSVQTMFLLEATWNNGGKPPVIEHPAAQMRAKLVSEGHLRWDDCESIRVEQLGQYDTRWTLRCPLCGEGTIARYKDDTPGFRDSHMDRCTNCGLTGDGVELKLESAHATFRSGTGESGVRPSGGLVP